MKLAEAYGCPGIRVQHSSEVEDAIRKAMAHKDGPILVEFAVAQEDNVYPMIPAGQTVKEMLDVPEFSAQSTNGAEHTTVMSLAKG